MTLCDTESHNENVFNLFARILMAVSLVCICILGVIGNLVVLFVAFRKQNYKGVTNCYIINLAITDLLFLLFSVPLTTYLGLTNTWILNGFVSCRVHIYLAHITFIIVIDTIPVVTNGSIITSNSTSLASTDIYSSIAESTLQPTTLNDITSNSANSIVDTTVTTVSTTTIYVPVNILNNSCTTSVRNPQTLLYISNLPSFAYTFHQFSFVATSLNTTLLFALRQDSSYCCLDDISVKSPNGQESIQDDTAFGRISTSCPYTGSYSYYDGAVDNPDYVSQPVVTTVGTTYNLTFWLRNEGAATNSATVIVGS